MKFTNDKLRSITVLKKLPEIEFFKTSRELRVDVLRAKKAGAARRFYRPGNQGCGRRILIEKRYHNILNL